MKDIWYKIAQESTNIKLVKWYTSSGIHCVVFKINDKFYEYILSFAEWIDKVRDMAKHSQGRALIWAKNHATQVFEVDANDNIIREIKKDNLKNKAVNKMKLKISKDQWKDIGKRAGWVKTAQELQVVKTPETFTDRELTRAIRDAIIAEEGAVKQYESVVDASNNSKVKEVLQDIADEEKVHVGELQELLRILLKDEQGFLDKGSEEVK